jgi:hypothetical protein
MGQTHFGWHSLKKETNLESLDTFRRTVLVRVRAQDDPLFDRSPERGIPKRSTRSAAGGTEAIVSCFARMSEPLPTLVESSLQIAWDFLGASGEIAEPQQTAEFLLRNIRSQIFSGERRTLMLSNRAIAAYRQKLPSLQLVS